MYGGNGPNAYDCSGFTVWVYRQHGYTLPRTAAEQYRMRGKQISRSKLRRGDLVFFKNLGTGKINHVGIYISKGKFIHAGSGSNDGGPKVKISRLDRGMYKDRFICGKRVIS